MDLISLTEQIVKSLALHKDSVSVKEFPTDEENEILIQVMIDSEDMGRVIGKGGKCANAIRTLCRAFAKADNRHIVVKIEHR